MCLHSIQCLGQGRIVVAISAAGTFRSLDGGATWEPHNRGVRADFMPEKFPEVGQCAEYRCNLNGALAVARSRDGGKTWKFMRRGLPQKNAHVTVLREAMTSDALSPAGVYFGTTGGTLYATRDAGENWSVLAENLPPVYSVEVR
jgi:BNR/Asp-box repeat protein